MLTTPLSVMPQLTFGAIGVLTLIVPGALKEAPAGPIVAAAAIGATAANAIAMALLHAKVLISFMIDLPRKKAKEMAGVGQPVALCVDLAAWPFEAPDYCYPLGRQASSCLPPSASFVILIAWVWCFQEGRTSCNCCCDCDCDCYTGCYCTKAR
ncbi:hypothetical protein PQQ68_18030 [Paraburkholderia dilworthii]|uniref:Proton-translocating NAD(P)(+) transhydrogenase n=1 Tax=Paraburkholderia dilworthii TaxID=948106 RepID=A0ABW9D9C5_9BURK